MSLKALIDQAKHEAELAAQGIAVLKPYVAPLHHQWLERPESEQDFSPEAAKKLILAARAHWFTDKETA